MKKQKTKPEPRTIALLVDDPNAPVRPTGFVRHEHLVELLEVALINARALVQAQREMRVH